MLAASGTRSMSRRGQVGVCAVVFVDGGGLRASGITAGCGGDVCAVREYGGVLGRTSTRGAVSSRCMGMLRARYTSVGKCTRRAQRARHMAHTMQSYGPSTRWRRARACARAHYNVQCGSRVYAPTHNGAPMCHMLPSPCHPASLRRHRAMQHNAPQPTPARPRDLARPRLTHRARRRRPAPRLLHRHPATAPPRAPPPPPRHTHTHRRRNRPHRSTAPCD